MNSTKRSQNFSYSCSHGSINIFRPQFNLLKIVQGLHSSMKIWPFIVRVTLQKGWNSLTFPLLFQAKIKPYNQPEIIYIIRGVWGMLSQKIFKINIFKLAIIKLHFTKQNFLNFGIFLHFP